MNDVWFAISIANVVMAVTVWRGPARVAAVMLAVFLLGVTLSLRYGP